MLRAWLGDLYLDICVDGTWKSDVFHVAKNQGDVWKLHTVDLTQYKADRTIFRFRAVTGSGWASDICIDDFKIAEDPSPIIQIVQTKPSSFDLKYYGSRIYFEVPENTQVSPVSIKLYNPQGKLVKILVNKNANPGSYSLQLENISTGLYLCRMEAAGFKKTIHVMISK